MEDEPGEEEEDEDEQEDNAGGTVDFSDRDSVPVYLKHLPTDEHTLVRQIAEHIGNKPEIMKHGMSLGGVHTGFPSDPSKPTTVCYVVQNLRSDKLNLGALPRADIIEELVANPLKTCKQRRDVTLADVNTVSHL